MDHNKSTQQTLTHLVQKFYKTDWECEKKVTSKQLTESFLSTADNKGIAGENMS